MMVMCMTGRQRIQLAVRSTTGLILHLHSHMLNVIMMRQKVLNTRQKGIMIVWRHYLHV